MAMAMRSLRLSLLRAQPGAAAVRPRALPCAASRALSTAPSRAMAACAARPRGAVLSALVRAAPSAGAPFGRRLLCSKSDRRIDSATVSAVGQAWAWCKQNTVVVGLVAGASLVMYGFYRVTMRTMKFFFNVSDKQIFTLGFMGGMIAAACIAGTGVIAARRLTFHVDDVYRAALKELRKHESVSEALGGFWRPGGFRGYAVESLQDAVKGSERRARASFLEAPARRVQMIFVVKGIERDGMVSLEAHKRDGSYEFEMLSLDLKESATLPADHLFLKGDDDHVLFQEVSDLLQAAKSHEK